MTNSTLIAALTAGLLMIGGSGAHAACQVKHGSVAEVFANGNASHTETDCASAATVATIQGDVAAQGLSITAIQGDVSALQTTVGAQGLTLIDHEGRIGTLEASSASHAITLADHETRIATGEATNATQDGQIATETARNDTQDGQIANHETRITGTEAVNAAQQTTLNTHTTQIAQGVAHDAVQDATLASHGATLSAHSALLSEHAATLTNHGNRINSLDKGVAIATAMPDAWLGDKQTFAIAGGLGGFGGETAIAFSAIGRLDETWTMNAGFGGDTEFKEFGWKAGVRAGW